MAKRKQVVFGNKDEKLLQYADLLPNFSNWVKEKIREELAYKPIKEPEKPSVIDNFL